MRRTASSARVSRLSVSCNYGYIYTYIYLETANTKYLLFLNSQQWIVRQILKSLDLFYSWRTFSRLSFCSLLWLNFLHMAFDICIRSLPVNRWSSCPIITGERDEYGKYQGYWGINEALLFKFIALPKAWSVEHSQLQKNNKFKNAA